MAAADKNAAASKMAAALAMVEAVVAKGRTVKLPDGKYAGAGKTVSLPEDEVTRLRSLGFLVAEAAPAAAAPEGSNPDGGGSTSPSQE